MIRERCRLPGQCLKHVNKPTAEQEHVAKVIAGKLPSLMCIDGDDYRELFRNYVFSRLYYQDPVVTYYRLSVGERTYRVGNNEKTSELTTILFLLNLALGQADEKQKKRAGGLIVIWSDADIFRTNMEDDFNGMEYLLAFLAKRAWWLDERVEYYMKNLDSVVLEPMY